MKQQELAPIQMNSKTKIGNHVSPAKEAQSNDLHMNDTSNEALAKKSFTNPELKGNKRDNPEIPQNKKDALQFLMGIKKKKTNTCQSLTVPKSPKFSTKM